MTHKWRVLRRDHDAERAICQNCGIVRTKVRQTDNWPQVTYRDQGGQVWRGTRPACRGKAAAGGALPGPAAWPAKG